MSCTCVDSAKFGPRNTCPYPPNRTCATLQLYCAHQSPMDQNSNSEQNNTVREAIEVVDEPRELPVSSQSTESCRAGLPLGIGTLETRTVTSAIARELSQRAEDNPGNADFLALGLGDDKLAVQIRALASGNAQEDSLVLSSDHMHPFNEVGTMGVNGPSVAETSSPVTTVLQSSHPSLTLRSLEPLEYGSSLGMHDQDTPSHQEQRLQLTAGGQPPRKRHCPTASESEASTPKEEFGPNLQSQLLAESMLQGDNFTTRLASSRPIGMAAAAAITSGQKKKKPNTFESNSALPLTEESQVFIETGEGDDDEHSELTTLSDGTLTETAARLQQQADETGQVQYATQTVTVCEKDSQALGQPAGTTTTVLLTAYPGGRRIMDESSVEDYRLQEETGQGEQTEGHESLQAVDQYLNTTDPRDVSLAQALAPADLALVSQFMTATKSSHIDN